jgi:hypothetical protein
MSDVVSGPTQTALYDTVEKLGGEFMEWGGWLWTVGVR